MADAAPPAPAASAPTPASEPPAAPAPAPAAPPAKIPKKLKPAKALEPLTDASVKAATASAIKEDSALREAAQTGTLTLKMVRKTVVRRMGLGDDGDATLKKQYKDLMKTEMLLVATALQDDGKPKEEEKPKAPKAPKAPKPKPKPKAKPKRVIEEEPEDDDEEEEEDDDESLDDEEIARREKEPHKDDHKFEKVPSEWKDRYADVAWVESQGFEHWPSIIYDPRWTKGNINASAMRYLGKKHVCLFYAMDASERFAYEPLSSIVPWEEGLRRGYDKNASHFKPKKYEKAFPKALVAVSKATGASGYP